MRATRSASVIALLCAALTGAQESSVQQFTAFGGRFATKKISGWVSTAEQPLPVIQPVRSLLNCLAFCGSLSECQSVVWAARGKTCDVSSNASMCNSYASVSDGDYYCGQKLERIFRGMPPFLGCRDARAAGINESAIVYVDPDGSGAFPVLCKFTGNESWLIIQRRMDGSQNFSRDWNSYRNGFGDFSTEFWLGLENIRRLSAGGVALSVSLEDFNETWAYANYTKFSIGDEDTNYRLYISGYKGNAGNSLVYHNTANFSTFDHDPTGRRCANMFTGGWWFNACVNSNLNGIYLRGPTSLPTANCWMTFTGRYYALKTTVMRLNV